MSLLGDLRAKVRNLTPPPVRQAVNVFRELVGGHRNLLYRAERGSLRGLEAQRPIVYRASNADELITLGPELDYDEHALQILLPRLALGDVVVLGEHAGTILCSGWLSFGVMDFPTVRLPIRNELAYAYKVFTHPDARGGGLMRGLYGHAARHVLPTGTEAIVATVSSHNAASRGAHEAAGFHCLGKMWDFHVGPAAVAVTDEAVARCVGRRAAATYG